MGDIVLKEIHKLLISTFTPMRMATIKRDNNKFLQRYKETRALIH